MLALGYVQVRCVGPRLGVRLLFGTGHSYKNSSSLVDPGTYIIACFVHLPLWCLHVFEMKTNFVSGYSVARRQ